MEGARAGSLFSGEEELTLWSSTQIPHLMRTQVALMIGLPENKLRVITPEVARFRLETECLCGRGTPELDLDPARQAGEMDRVAPRNMQGRFMSRSVGTIEVGCKNDGTITGLRYNVFADLGAYHQLLTRQFRP